jgi:hypothetical protein
MTYKEIEMHISGAEIPGFRILAAKFLDGDVDLIDTATLGNLILPAPNGAAFGNWVILGKNLFSNYQNIVIKRDDIYKAMCAAADRKTFTYTFPVTDGDSMPTEKEFEEILLQRGEALNWYPVGPAETSKPSIRFTLIEDANIDALRMAYSPLVDEEDEDDETEEFEEYEAPTPEAALLEEISSDLKKLIELLTPKPKMLTFDQILARDMAPKKEAEPEKISDSEYLAYLREGLNKVKAEVEGYNPMYCDSDTLGPLLLNSYKGHPPLLNGDLWQMIRTM